METSSVVAEQIQLVHTSVVAAGVDADAELARARSQTAEKHRQSCPNRCHDASESQTTNKGLVMMQDCSSQCPEGISPQKVTETLNVLVNDGSNVGACTLDLIALPNLLRR